MGARFAENGGFYIYSVFVLVYATQQREVRPQQTVLYGDPVRRRSRAAGHPVLRRALGPRRTPARVSLRGHRDRGVRVSAFLADRHGLDGRTLVGARDRVRAARTRRCTRRRRRSCRSCSARACATAARRSGRSWRRSSPAGCRRSSRRRSSVRATPGRAAVDRMASHDHRVSSPLVTRSAVASRAVLLLPPEPHRPTTSNLRLDSRCRR